MDLVVSLGPILCPLLSCLCIWISLYAIISIINTNRSPEWNCRLVTIIHAIVSTALSYWCAFRTGPWPFDTFGEASTQFQTLIATITLGYFLFDFTWCLYMGTEGLNMLAHHMISVYSLSYIVINGYSGSEIVATIFGSEMTNPFLQMRWFLRETGNYELRIAYINDLVFLTLFLFLRLGPGTSVLYWTLKSSKPALVVKAGGIGLYLVGVVWSFYIMLFACKRFFGKKKVT
ncbi:predicted protein [Nematostella vectensis]|uniref:TLC domain-containing protein n=1 Tax=Nematostella vectensis TaxID=45351 RepID=A7SAB8_NEMVE|nr:TLC domain-containing protein 5 [Nematostella vectensis]EDO39371.1 predicted protein [Nematostella vectensis]|eukprot:XP_001631434.1 predicted protein [Nematostella vectensis]